MKHFKFHRMLLAICYLLLYVLYLDPSNGLCRPYLRSDLLSRGGCIISILAHDDDMVAMSHVPEAVVFTTIANFTHTLRATIAHAMARGGAGGWRQSLAERIQGSYADAFSPEGVMRRAGVDAMFEKARARRQGRFDSHGHRAGLQGTGGRPF